MEAPKRIALLLFGLGVAELTAEGPLAAEDRSSPIFAPPVPGETTTKPLRSRTGVERELASLIRQNIAAVPAVEQRGTEVAVEDAVQLEKMTVEGKKILAPALRETGPEKFARTGYLLEFSKTKRLMIGPRGDKVGLMFSFDW